MTSCEALYCTSEKGKCENFLLLLPVRTILVNTSTSDHEKHGKVDSVGDKQEQKHVYAQNELKLTVI